MMALAYRCNRCEGFYAAEDCDEPFARIIEMSTYNNESYRDQKTLSKEFNLDLCPYCYRSFVEWFNRPRRIPDLIAEPHSDSQKEQTP